MSTHDEYFDDAREAYEWCQRQAIRDGWEPGTVEYRTFMDVLFAEVWTNAK